MPRKKSKSPESKMRNVHRWSWPAELSEADLERYGTDLLVLDGWRALKTDPVSDRSRGKGFGEKGMADHLYLRYYHTAPYFGEILWIEWKRRKGKAKPHQLIWIEKERAKGAIVWLADEDFVATPECFFAHYQASGLMRKNLEPSLRPFRSPRID